MGKNKRIRELLKRVEELEAEVYAPEETMVVGEDEPELKPCPFCGWELEVYVHHGDKYALSCNNDDDCILNCDFIEGRDKIVKLANKRAPRPIVVTMAEANWIKDAVRVKKCTHCGDPIGGDYCTHGIGSEQ